MEKLETYRGWVISWTGWKTMPNMLEIVSQWIASNGGTSVFVSSGGVAGTYRSGDCFDMSIREEYGRLQSTSCREQLEYCEERSLGLIKKIIDAFEIDEKCGLGYLDSLNSPENRRSCHANL